MNQNKTKKNESILAGVLKYSVSSLANLFIGFFSVLITTRIIMPDVYGQIVLFTSSSTVLMYVLIFGLDGAYIRFFNEPPANNSSQQLLYKNLVISTTICFLSGIIIYYLFGSDLSQFIWKSNNRILIIYLFTYTFFQIILRFFNITFRMGFKAKSYNIQNITINCLSRILIILGALYKNDYLFIISLITMGYLVVVTFYTFLQRDYYIPYNKEKVKDFSISLNGYGEYFKFALFSAPTYIVFYANIMLSQQIISNALTAKALGIFSSSGVFSSILRAFSSGFANYWAAFVYKNYKDEKNTISKMHDYVFLFAIIASSLIIIFRDYIYLFIGSNYHDSKQFFSLLLIFPILQLIAETTAKGIQLVNKNHISLIIHTLSVFINLILCYILVNKYGLIGAASANAMSGISLYCLNTIFGQKYYKSISSYPKSCFGFISLIGVLIIPSIYSNISDIIFYIILIDMVVFIAYFEEIKLIIKKTSKYINTNKQNI